MNEEEFKNYVDRVNKRIVNKLKNNNEESKFYIHLVKKFNEICEENQELKKQQEVISKMNKLLRQEQDAKTTTFHYDIVGLINELLDILKEVSE